MLAVFFIIALAVLTGYIVKGDFTREREYRIKTNKPIESMGESTEEGVTDLERRRLEYLERRNDEVGLYEGFRVYNEIIKRLTENGSAIEVVEEALVESGKYRYKEIYPESTVEDSEENGILKKLECRKELERFWEERGVEVFHYIHLGLDGRFIYFEFNMRM